MTNLEDVLARLWSQLPGCRVAAVVGMDGLLVERHPPETNGLGSAPAADELEHVAADLTTVLTLVAGEMSRQVGGAIDELVALGETGGYLVNTKKTPLAKTKSYAAKISAITTTKMITTVV